MSKRRVIWEGSSIYLPEKSLLVIVDGVIREEYTCEDGSTTVFSLSSFLDDWERGEYTGPPLPEEVKVELALREIKR